ncbi:transcription-repair coupling factor [Corynebacterium sputi]|uniref:transcription-repair coupling factor n=1 Tax=Corynebacterium sputi TaxID=489915 RepID=UPI000550FEE7|nr:transcription-repair coupling factor [Corynebacterium sputi]
MTDDSAAAPLGGLARVVATDSQFRGVLTRIGEPELAMTGIDELRPFLVASMESKAPVLAVTATGREAEDLASELRAMVGRKVALFPSWETLPHERLSPAVDTVAQRRKALHEVAEGNVTVVVAAVRSLLQPVLNDGASPISLAEGEEVADLPARLQAYGYSNVDMVGRRGQFAVRGGIVDIFPATEELPVRVELWGDEVTELRAFSVGDQRTIEDTEAIERVDVFPVRALLLDASVRAKADTLAAERSGDVQEMLVRISDGQWVEGMEALIPLLTEAPMDTLPQLMPEGTHTLLCGPERIRSRAVDLIQTGEEFLSAAWETAAMGGTAPIAEDGLQSTAYRGLDEVRVEPWWSISPPGMLGESTPDDVLPLTFEASPRPRGDLKEIGRMIAQLREATVNEERVAYVGATPASARRQAEKFREAGISCRIATGPEEPEPGRITVYRAVNHGGVVFPRTSGGALTVIAETDVTGNRVADIGRGRKAPAKRRNRVDPLALQAGDFVVHDTHGIGRFVKLTERTIGTGDDQARREYVVLEYAPSKRGGPPDQLFVPMESLDLLSRYVGGETPSMSKMGGSDWKNSKKKARGAVREIAHELVKLYAERQAAPGHPFATDSPWQREMEDNFPYQETEDQLTAIDEIKTDMEGSSPMDRVLIGDVGYGKTEVALRAAFKAVQDGRQVAVLVPTTLLAQQHLATFNQRMEGFPVTIRGLSRFTSTKESKEIIKGMGDGTVDIVIGTHRLLQTGVHWKQLGLVIVDEEQRFGVEHKEHIKALRNHVDVLTMSATPIPRTLEMSMAGIREMSQILTPPEDRHPVLTYVGAQSDKQVAAAIRRELLRDGQVFYLHNRVKTIDRAASKIRELVPEARVVVAHGQMNEEQLEKTVQGFWDREYDVLVCTTIVETGLDIPNANTLIVEDSHHMGLSQLHQLRGRVGRSRERAYAYFLYPADHSLTETSYDRLATIASNNDLGAGMAVAMKDLEMRGAGNVLGAEQSGHIAGVGFDMYIRLVGEAVQALKSAADGEPVDAGEPENTEVRIDLPVDANIPAEYVASERLRLEGYRKFAEARALDEVDVVLDELRDRYGEPPVEVLRLATMSRLRIICREFKVREVSASGQHISIAPMQLADSKQVRLKRLYPGSTYRAASGTVNVPVPREGRGLRAKPVRDVALVQWVANFLTGMAGIPTMDITGDINIPAAS